MCQLTTVWTLIKVHFNNLLQESSIVWFYSVSNYQTFWISTVLSFRPCLVFRANHQDLVLRVTTQLSSLVESWVCLQTRTDRIHCQRSSIYLHRVLDRPLYDVSLPRNEWSQDLISSNSNMKGRSLWSLWSISECPYASNL